MSSLTRWERVMTRWNPFKDLEDMEKRLSTYLGRPAVRTEAGKEAMPVAEWSPLVDITEDDKEYLIKADLPEVKKEDVKLTVQDDGMSISGERKYEKEEKGKKCHRVERAYGSFLRSFTLPEDTDDRGESLLRRTERRCIMFRHPHYLKVPWDIHGSSRDHGTSSSSVVADRAVGSVRHVSDRHRRHEWNHLAAPAVRSMAGRRGVSDFQEPGRCRSSRRAAGHGAGASSYAQ